MAYFAPNGLAVDFAWGSGIYAAPSGLAVDFQWPATESELHSAGATTTNFIGRVVAQGVLAAASVSSAGAVSSSSLESSAFIEGYGEFAPLSAVVVPFSSKLKGVSVLIAVAEYPYAFKAQGKAATKFVGSLTAASVWSSVGSSSVSWRRYGQYADRVVSLHGVSAVGFASEISSGRKFLCAGGASFYVKGQATRDSAWGVVGRSAASFVAQPILLDGALYDGISIQQPEQTHVVF